VWDDPAPTNTTGSVVSQLTPVGPVLALVAGQTWYQLIADRTRPDHLVYGRYNDAVMAPIVLVGIGVLATASRTRLVRDGALTLAMLVTSGAVLVYLAGDELAGPGTVRMMVLGLLPFLGRSLTVEALPLTLIAGLLLSGLGTLAGCVQRRARPPIVLAAVLALALAAAHRARPAVDQGLNSSTFGQAESLRGILPDATVVRVRLHSTAAEPTVGVGTLRMRMAEYQFALLDTSFVLDGLEDRQTPYVIAAADDPELSAARATVVWRDLKAPIALWYVNGG